MFNITQSVMTSFLLLIEYIYYYPPRLYKQIDNVIHSAKFKYVTVTLQWKDYYWPVECYLITIESSQMGPQGHFRIWMNISSIPCSVFNLGFVNLSIYLYSAPYLALNLGFVNLSINWQRNYDLYRCCDDAQIQNLIIQHGYRTIPHWQHPSSNVTPINTC